MNAIDEIITKGVDYSYLGLEKTNPVNELYFKVESDSNNKQKALTQNKFIIKLKDAFLNMYLKESYCKDGLDEQDRELAQNDELQMDENTLALIEYFKHVQNRVISPNSTKYDENKENEINNQDFGELVDYSKVDISIQKNNDLRFYLFSKFLIFSCFSEQSSQEYLNYFKMMKDGGLKWLEDNLNDEGDLVAHANTPSDFNDPEIKNEPLPQF